MPLIRIGSVSALRPGEAAEGEADGNVYAICCHEGEVHVFDGSCPCTGGPLGQGTIRDGLLVCPWHGMRYDAHTGVCAYDPNVRLTQFPVEIRGDDILIRIPSSSENP
jgi:nitrite reductase/ring-hydroxylating ferredoxin subunit